MQLILRHLLQNGRYLKPLVPQLVYPILPTVTHLNTNSAPRPSLRYPFEKGFHPKPGVPFEVASGVFWVRLPLPIALDHINLWLLRDGDGWVIVDSGYDDPICTAVWDQVFAEFCDPLSVKKIIVTHYHPDHIGLAAWLAHRCNCNIHITHGELQRYRGIVDRAGHSQAPEITQFIAELGFDQPQQETYANVFMVDDKPAQSRVQVSDCAFIAAGDILEIDSREWHIVVGSGHSPEHACLYCPELEVMISGDQVLPRISSNISVYYSNKGENPLANWLESCARLRDTISNDTLILPAHQEPFYGLQERMQQLIDDHQAQLNKLRLHLNQPMSAAQAHKVLFTRELNSIETLLATGETLAHINLLMHAGEIESKKEDGVVYFNLTTAN